MEHKPGCPGALPGWGKTKNAIEMYVSFLLDGRGGRGLTCCRLHNQGR